MRHVVDGRRGTDNAPCDSAEHAVSGGNAGAAIDGPQSAKVHRQHCWLRAVDVDLGQRAASRIQPVVNDSSCLGLWDT